jgi:Zn-dependent M28 family amino/carboxypeptidase
MRLICLGTDLSDTSIIKSHLTTLTKTPKFRTEKNIDQLNKTADYIKSVFARYSDSVSFQEYTVNGQIYKNVICSFGTENNKRIIVGAHYDVCGNQEGADDNASGVVGLLELSRLLKGKKLNQRIDLVAYTLEEPPYFRTEYMGSYVHAKSLVDKGIAVYGMISLEMIGYFKDEKKSQSYPIGLLSLFYGNKGDYITLVKKFGAGQFVRKFCRTYKSTKAVRTKKFSAPAAVPGVDFSDHLNYWKFGFDALMITDTSFYRNKNYHEATDTMDTLDIPRMAKVIDGVFTTLAGL